MSCQHTFLWLLNKSLQRHGKHLSFLLRRWSDGCILCWRTSVQWYSQTLGTHLRFGNAGWTSFQRQARFPLFRPIGNSDKPTVAALDFLGLGLLSSSWFFFSWFPTLTISLVPFFLLLVFFISYLWLFTAGCKFVESVNSSLATFFGANFFHPFFLFLKGIAFWPLDGGKALLHIRRPMG